MIDLHNLSINIECPAKINEIQMKRYKGSKNKRVQIFSHCLGAIAFKGH